MLKKRLNFRELLKDTEEAKSGLNCYNITISILTAIGVKKISPLDLNT